MTRTSSPVITSVAEPGSVPGFTWCLVMKPSISTSGTTPSATWMMTRENGRSSGLARSG
jgi:hypothetical protein